MSRRSSRRLSAKNEPSSPRVKEESPPITPRKKVKRDEDIKVEIDDEKVTLKTPTKKVDLAAQKLKKLASYNDPYPTFSRPTPEECKKVVDLLSTLHGPAIRPKGKPIDDDSVGTNCGAVPDIIDALVRTILSQNTTSKNSSAAKRTLDDTFGKANWEAIHKASIEELEDAIRVAGLAPSKSRTIKEMLSTTYEKYGVFSLNHLHDSTTEEAIIEMIGFKGVGPKTASCTALFCMQRDSFAVDTHVFRLSKSLGWCPEKANREQCFGHLDARIPSEFKYPLHTLLITHGKRCARCSAHKVNNMLEAAKCPLKGMN